MLKLSNPDTMPKPAAHYSQVCEIPAGARIVTFAGLVGMRLDGTTPDGFQAQHAQIWENTLAGLASVGMGPEDIVRLTVYSTDPTGLQYVADHRNHYMGGHLPPSTWIVVAGLANPTWCVEMDTIAAKLD